MCGNVLEYGLVVFSAQAYAAGVQVSTIGDGSKVYNYWNLANTSYYGLFCPYLRLAALTDEPDNLLDWFVDPGEELRIPIGNGLRGSKPSSAFVNNFKCGHRIPY